MNFRDVPALALAQRIRSGEVSAREVVQAALDNIEATNGVLNAFVAVDADAALATATALDQRIARGEDVGPLAGLPLAVKDAEPAQGYRTCYGSRTRLDRPVDDVDSTLVSRLKAAGSIVVGKTNTPEFGLKATTDNRAFGISGNPHDPARTCGGSSGGSAAAVAAGVVPIATASDGGGSIRIPAAVCGLFGFKPSNGQIPSADVAAPGWPLVSTRGVLTADVASTRVALQAVRGHDPGDIRTMPLDASDWSRPRDPAEPLRIGWCPTLGYADVDDELAKTCRAALDRLADNGAVVVDVEAVLDPIARWPLGVLVGAYISRTIDSLRGTEGWKDLDPVVALTGELARLTTTAEDVVRALGAMHDINRRFLAATEGLDLIACPTLNGQTPIADAPVQPEQLVALIQQVTEAEGGPSAAVVDQLLASVESMDPLNVPTGLINGSPSADWFAMTQPVNIMGAPAGTAVAGLTADGMPVGLQLIGRRHDDLTVLRGLSLVEQVVGAAPRPAAVSP